MADEIKQQLSLDAGQALTSIKQLETALAQLEATAKSTGAALSNFRSANPTAVLNQTGRAANQAANNVTRLTVSWSMLGRIVTTQVIVKAMRVFQDTTIDAVQSAIRFETALARIQTIADGSFGSLQNLSTAVTDFSAKFGVGLDDAADSLQQVVSSQVAKGKEAIDILRESTLMAKGLGVETSKATNLLTGSLNAFGLEASEAGKVASIFFRMVDKGNVNVEELITSFNRVTGRAKALGLSIEDVAAQFIVLTNKGIKPSEAATQISGIISAFEKPSDALKQKIKELGFESGSAMLRLLGVDQALEKLKVSTNGSSNAMARLFPNVRALSGVTVLTTNNTRDLTAAIVDLEKNVPTDLSAQMGLEVMSTDAQKVARDINLAKTRLVQFGQAATHVIANNLRFFGFGDEDLDLEKKASREKALREQIINDFSRLDNEKIKRATSAFQQSSEIQLAEVESIRKAGSLSLSAAETAIQNLVNARQRGIQTLQRQSGTLRNALTDSPVPGLQQRQSRRDFDTRNEGLSDAQRSLALLNLANDQASQAASKLAAAAQTGDKHAIQQARALFETAQATGEEAKSLAQSAGERNLAAHAARRLKDITDGQVSAEQRLSQIAQQRIPTLDRQKAAQQANLDTIKAALKDLSANSNLFDSANNPLSPDALKQAAANRTDALKRLSQAGVDNSTLVKIHFDTEAGLREMQEKVRGAGDKFRLEVPFVGRLEEVLGKESGALNTAAGVTAGLEEASKKATELRAQMQALTTDEAKMRSLKQSIASAPPLIAEDQPKTVAAFNQIKQQMIDLSRTGQIADTQIKSIQTSITNFGGGPGGDALQATLDKLKQLQTVQTQLANNPAATGVAQQQLQQLDAVLKQADPSAPFASIKGSIEIAIPPATTLANEMERAASASGRIQIPTLPSVEKALGGSIGYFAGGGRGIDTVPAMLSPGEFVVNARQSGRFFSQLQSINAGMTPNFRGAGGNINSNNVGDVSVHIKASDPNKINGREIGRALRQEIRRGNLRI